MTGLVSDTAGHRPPSLHQSARNSFDHFFHSVSNIICSITVSSFMQAQKITVQSFKGFQVFCVVICQQWFQQSASRFFLVTRCQLAYSCPLSIFSCSSFLTVTLDLSDEDGDIKNLHEFPTQYAHKFLKGREVFILIKVESKCWVLSGNPLLSNKVDRGGRG